MIIYSISDLVSKPFDDEEIEKVNKYLIYSLVIGMFKHVKINLDDKEIISLIKKDNWFAKYNWTKKQRDSYKKILDKIFYNLYRFGPIKCSNSSEEFLIKYGFEIKLIKPIKKNGKK